MKRKRDNKIRIVKGSSEARRPPAENISAEENTNARLDAEREVCDNAFEAEETPVAVADGEEKEIKDAEKIREKSPEQEERVAECGGVAEQDDNSGKRRKMPLKERFIASLKLFLTFFKMGIICFGGGYAMISLIEREVVEKKKWITSDEMLEIVAIAESTPGAIAINMATYIGTKQAGLLGAIFATIGVVMPSFIIIYAISSFITEFIALKWVSYAFRGIRAAVLVLILNAVIKLLKKTERTVFAIIAIIGAFLLCFFTKLDVVIVLLIFGALGLVYNFVKRVWEAKKKQ